MNNKIIDSLCYIVTKYKRLIFYISKNNKLFDHHYCLNRDLFKITGVILS